MQKNQGCFAFWYTSHDNEDEDDDLLDQKQTRLSKVQSRTNSRYTMSIGSLIGNEFAKEVKIGAFMDTWKSIVSPSTEEQDLNEIKWQQLVKFIDDRCVEFITEIDPSFTPSPKKKKIQKTQKASSFLQNKKSQEYENIEDLCPRRIQSVVPQKILLNNEDSSQQIQKIVSILNQDLSYEQCKDQQLTQKNQQSENSLNSDTSPKRRSLDKNNSKETDISDSGSKAKWKLVYKFKDNYQFVMKYKDVQMICLSILQKKDFRLAVYDGPPQDLRWSCWKVLLLRDQPKIFNLHYENQLELECLASECIQKELHRTLVKQPFLQCDNHKMIGQQQLERVLMAVANFLQDVSYCQGMNFLACYLLMNSSADEANSFKAFISLLLSPKHLMKYSYKKDLPLLQFLCFVVHEQMKLMMPDVEQKLGPDTDSLWLQKYILTLFLDTIESDKCLRFWDYILLRGTIRAIPELTLGILQQIRPLILVLQDIELYEALTKRLEKNISINLTISLARRQFRIQSSKIRLLAKAFLSKNKKFSEDFKQDILNYNPQIVLQSIESSFIKI